MSEKCTEWFDGNKFVPAHVGVYERDYSDDESKIYYCKWDGEKWMFYDLKVDRAYKENVPSDYQDLKWRGLANKP